jgi:hypothetical protein
MREKSKGAIMRKCHHKATAHTERTNTHNTHFHEMRSSFAPRKQSQAVLHASPRTCITRKKTLHRFIKLRVLSCLRLEQRNLPLLHEAHHPAAASAAAAAVDCVIGALVRFMSKELPPTLSVLLAAGTYTTSFHPRNVVVVFAC